MGAALAVSMANFAFLGKARFASLHQETEGDMRVLVQPLGKLPSLLDFLLI